MKRYFTIFRKDVTRFLPLWGGYCLALLLAVIGFGQWTLSPAGRYHYTYWVIHILTVVYAPLCAITLFGDLYHKARCQAIHALPISRLGWFCTQALAGALFFLIPTALCFALTGGLISGSFVKVCLLFALCYGLSLTCVMLSGNRLGAIAMYFAAHALPLVLEWFYTCFYQPYLPSVGVPIVESVVPSISPRGILYRTLLNFYGTQMAAFVLPGIAGVALTVVAMLLYRFRKLERAGSFAAVRGLSHLFLGAFSLIAAAVLFLLLGHAREQFWFLFLYVPVFYFAGAMVVEKRFHVFRAGNLFTLGILAAVLFNSLWIVKYDAFGLLTYVPKSENVRRVEVYADVAGRWGLQYDHGFFSKEGITITDPEDIEAVTQVHSQLLEKATVLDARRMVYLTYTLKSGIRVRRYYPIPTGEKSYELFQELDKATSSTSALFGNVQLEDYVNQVYYIHVQSEGIGDREFYFADPSFTTDVGAGDVKIHHPAMGLQFLKHLREDAQEGNLRQLSYVQYTVTIKSRDAWGREKTVVLTLPHLAGASAQYLELTWEAARQLPQKTITEEHNYQQLLLDAMLP